MSSIADWAKPNPVHENRGGVIGKPVDRYEGPLKVTGTAPYAYEVETPAPAAYGYIVTSTVARGRITAVDAGGALASPGVKLVWSHLNIPKQAERAPGTSFFVVAPLPALTSDHVDYFGQPIALVVADTFENAAAGAALLKIDYAVEPGVFLMDENLDKAVNPDPDPDPRKGEFEPAFAAAPVTVDDVWSTPIQNHCSMEVCASTAWWEDGTCIVHTSAQAVGRTAQILALTLQVPAERVKLRTRYIGGGFGAKGFIYEDLALAALASRELAQPVKIAFTRQQMFHATSHRAATSMHVQLGAERDGTLTSISMVTTTHCQVPGAPFVERASNFARSLYAAPNRRFGHRLLRLDLPYAGPMRAPGEAPGMLSLECAMDELAEKLGMDPVDLRLMNEPEVHPESGKPFSLRQLERCLKEGSQMFGWERRRPQPGQVRDGRWLIGYGMAAAIRGNMLLPAKCTVLIEADGMVTVRQGMTDIGTGTYTVLAQIAAETLGVPLEMVRVEIGDSEFAPAPGSGGQFGAGSAGSAALMAGMKLRTAIAELAVNDAESPLHGGSVEAVTFQSGVVAIGNRSETLAALIRRSKPDGLEVEGEITPLPEAQNWSQSTYGAHFCEVAVDPITGETVTRRMLGVFAAGRILNLKTARSQLTGGMIWGVASALHEGNDVDPRYGSFIAQDLAGYHVPVQADIGEVEAIMLDEVDDKANPLGIKGVGELGIAGAGAAVANAVYNAVGVRVRDYPITPDKILTAMAEKGL